jgi:uncharacterized protein
MNVTTKTNFDRRKLAGYRHQQGLALHQARSGVRLEKRADGKRMIRGYAAVFYDAANREGTEYWLWSDIVERIMPGAFDRAIAEKHDARGLFNHDANCILGRVSSGNSRLGVDSFGLWYEIDEDPTDPDWQRVAAKIDRGDVTGSSFAFVATRTTWSEVSTDTEQYWIRQIEDVDLYDYSPVTWPAYSGTTAGRTSGSSLQVRALADDERSELMRERNAYLDDTPALNARLAELGMDLL